MIVDLDGATIKTNPGNGFKSLHAAIEFKQGEILTAFKPLKNYTIASRYTIQTGEDQHIELEPVILKFVNHSCRPNLFFDIQAMQIICLEAIHMGDAFTYFYPSTEWELREPFYCKCGSENCIQLIKGAAYLDNGLITKYRFTDFILKKLHLLRR